MSDVPSHLDLLRDPRLATHATSATPVWLWGADATRILWANSVGAAIFGSETPAALIGRRFDPHDPAAAQIGRLAGSLPQGGPGRLERLRAHLASRSHDRHPRRRARAGRACAVARRTRPASL